MNRNFKKGFTLIELLVVIAIIGILSAVVLASLNAARGKGQEAAIRSDLNNMRAQAELFYDSNGQSYVGACTDPAIVRALNGANTTNGTAGNVACAAAATTWAIAADIATSTSNVYYCVDSTGASKTNWGAQVSGITGYVPWTTTGTTGTWTQCP